MKKKFICLLCVSAIILCGCNKNTETVTDSQSVQKEEVADIQNSEQQITEQQIAEAENKWQEQKKRHDEYEQELNDFFASEGEIDSEQLQQMIDRKIVQAYKENSVIALETKSMIIESLDVNASGQYRTYSQDTDDMLTGMMSDAAIDHALSFVGDDNVKDLLKDGIEGGMEEYTDSDSMSAALKGAQDSIVDGIKCKISSAPLEMAGAALDGTAEGLGNLATSVENAGSLDEYLTNVGDSYSNGLISSITGMDEKLSEYEGTPGALLNSMSTTINREASALKQFLEKESITSADLSTAVSSYIEFASMVESMEEYGIAVDCECMSSCASIQGLYDKYFLNENMIALLSKDDSIDIVPEDYRIDITAADIPNTNFKDIEEFDKADAKAYYSQIIDEIKKIEEENAALQEISDKIDDLLRPMKEYRDQIAQIKDSSKNLLEYEEAEMEFSVDEDGIEKMKEINKFHAGVGEVMGAIPILGDGLSLFFSGAVSNSDRYYEKLTATATEFVKAQASSTKLAHEDITKFKKQIMLYEDMTRECDTKTEELKNLMIMDYILEGKPIDLSSCREKAYKSLYALGCSYDLIYEFYNILNPNSAEDFWELYDEIETILEDDGMSEIMDHMTADDLKDSLIPVIKAGNSGMAALEDISIDIPDMDYRKIKVNIYGGVFGGAWLRCTVKGGVKTHMYTEGMDVYYADGNLVYANGLFIYKDIPLNGTADMETLLSEAKWMFDMDESREQVSEFSEHYYPLCDAIQNIEENDA